MKLSSNKKYLTFSIFPSTALLATDSVEFGSQTRGYGIVFPGKLPPFLQHPINHTRNVRTRTDDAMLFLQPCLTEPCVVIISDRPSHRPSSGPTHGPSHRPNIRFQIIGRMIPSDVFVYKFLENIGLPYSSTAMPRHLVEIRQIRLRRQTRINDGLTTDQRLKRGRLDNFALLIQFINFRNNFSTDDLPGIMCISVGLGFARSSNRVRRYVLISTKVLSKHA